MRPEILMMVGLPGSGKGFWIQNFLATQPPRKYAIVSSDDTIEIWRTRDSLTYEQAIATYSRELISAHLQGIIDNAIYHGHSIIWDQTNLVKEDRITKLEMLPERYRRVAVWFDLPHEISDTRRFSPSRVAQGKTIPEEVIANFKAVYTPPDLTEFDEIIRVDK